MGKTYDTINEKLRTFIEHQQMFFVATAPLSGEGHVNSSPKGLDSFRILDERTVAYADLIGSGIETAAHLRENGRICLMFCAFDGPPNIVRLQGRGEVVDPHHADFESLKNAFPDYTGLRCFIRVTCDRISDSCGYAVPRYEYVGQRSQLTKWAERKGSPALEDYVRDKNAFSIDGLPGLDLDGPST